MYEDEGDLQECFNFAAPNHSIRMTVSNFGDDDWKPELFRVLFDDHFYVLCPDGEFIGNSESHTLMCEMLSPVIGEKS